MNLSTKPKTDVYALISTSNKTGLIELAQSLIDLNIKILATDGTAHFLQQNNIPSQTITQYTGSKELLNGRVKTLHPKIHAGILARRGIDDAELNEQQIAPIDIVIVNLYPFEQIIQQPDCDLSHALAHIDIGGSTLIRAAAKNHPDVTVLVDPDDYSQVITELQHNSQTSLATRERLAVKAFCHSAHYDHVIAHYFQNTFQANSGSDLPDTLHLHLPLAIGLRYGENPQQAASCYRDDMPNSLVAATLLQGKPLSYNNLLDADAALNCLRSLNAQQAACVIVKHATPCGAAYGTSLTQAYQGAYATDPQSCFGGIIALNQNLESTLAEQIIKQQFVEVILAPNIEASALAILQQKPNIRVLATGHAPKPPQPTLQIRSISGGLLAQQHDYFPQKEFTVAGKHVPTPSQHNDLLFAWRIVRFAKSNAIVYAKDNHTLGIGTGQTSRVFSAKIAALKAEEANLTLHNAVMASDAFFPFADSIAMAAKHGISAIIQPGGSKRDKEVIQAADDAGIAMLLTHTRHFCH